MLGSGDIVLYEVDPISRGEDRHYTIMTTTTGKEKGAVTHFGNSAGSCEEVKLKLDD